MMYVILPDMEEVVGSELETITTAIKLTENSVPAAISVIQRVWFKTRAEAEEQVLFYERMLNTLSKSMKVFVRTKPEWFKDADFETDEVKWHVNVRFTLGYGDGNPELIQSNYIYDNEMKITGFGLTP
jgi:hypothetical protein